jgi:two-component system, chemotaxis family, chemotaxis protein CheY
MSLHTLVVDDSAVMRSMLIRTLRLSGLPLTTVEQAGNGEEALEVLARTGIDLALIDLSMPVMDGEALLVKMRENQALARIGVLVVSTEGSQTRIDRLTELGAVFIRKPFTPEEVRTAALRVLGAGDA